MYQYITILILGFIAQYIDGSLGMGYGASSASLLIAAGFLPALVSASVHTAEIVTSLVSGVSHLKFGNVDKHIVTPLIVSGIVGGFIGAYLLSSISGNTIKPIVAIILIIAGIRIFMKFRSAKNGLIFKGKFTRNYLLSIGFIGSTFDAVGGGGWGPICTTSLLSANKTEPRLVIGSVNLAEFVVTITIVLTFGYTIGFENFFWFIVIPLMIGGVIAAPVAAYTCRKIPPRILGILVGMLLIILNVRTLLLSI